MVLIGTGEMYIIQTKLHLFFCEIKFHFPFLPSSLTVFCTHKTLVHLLVIRLQVIAGWKLFLYCAVTQGLGHVTHL